MNETFERYASGIGLPIGAGIGGTAALVADISAEFAIVTAFGGVGGLVVGGFAGRYAATSRGERNWALRLLAVTLLVGLAAGASLGVLTAWMVDGSLAAGVVAGSTAGGLFSHLLGGILVLAERSGTRRGAPA